MSGFGSGIITRGLGTTTIITRGYAGFWSSLVEAVRRGIAHGRSSRRHEPLENEVTIRTKLIEVNGQPPKSKIESCMTIKYDQSNSVVALVEHVSTRIARFVTDIVITVKRVTKDT